MPQNSKLNYYTMLQLLYKLQTFYMPNSILLLKQYYSFNKDTYNFTLESIMTSGICYYTISLRRLIWLINQIEKFIVTPFPSQIDVKFHLLCQ